MDEQQQRIIDLWAAGKPAPYALYRSQRYLDGQPILVEAGRDLLPAIAAGATIPPEIAAAVANQVNPPPEDPITVQVLKRDADGNVLFNEDGSPQMVDEEIEPRVEPVMLSDHSTLPGAEEETCDMCGVVRAELFQIGIGWYCKVANAVPGRAEGETCHTIRMKQLGA